MGAGHSHEHAHDVPADHGRAFAIGIVLNTGFVIVEAVYGLVAGSMALIADAGHNLSDVLALLLAWGASVAAKKPASARFTYGYKSSTILAALANAALLLVAIGMILVETVQRFADPQPIEAGTVMLVAGIGILDQHRHGAALPARAQARHQHSRRVPAYGGGRAGFGRRGRGRGADLVDRGAVDRSGHQPRHRRGDRLGNLGAREGQLPHGAACGARGRGREPRARRSRRAARR